MYYMEKKKTDSNILWILLKRLNKDVFDWNRLAHLCKFTGAYCWRIQCHWSMYFAQWRVTGACCIQSIDLLYSVVHRAQCLYVTECLWPCTPDTAKSTCLIFHCEWQIFTWLYFPTLLSSGCWFWFGFPGKIHELELWSTFSFSFFTKTYPKLAREVHKLFTSRQIESTQPSDYFDFGNM